LKPTAADDSDSYFGYQRGKQEGRLALGQVVAPAAPVSTRFKPGINREPPPPADELKIEDGDSTTIIKAIRGALLRKLMRGE
jgi:hypothetical protein